MTFRATYNRKDKRNANKLIAVDCVTLAQAWEDAIETAFALTEDDEILVKLEQVTRGD